MSSDYERLVAKVDALAETLTDRLRESLSCAPGCASCCHVELSVSAVEADAIGAHIAALDDDARTSIAARAERHDGRCVMLDDDSLCSIFAVRPLVCRTQGLPLLYPHDFVPAEAVLARTNRGSITACPLNFRDRVPTEADSIDATRLDTMLALVDRLESERLGAKERDRVAIRELARRAL